MTSDSALNTAVQFLGQGNFSGAKALLEEFVASHPFSGMAWHLLAVAAFRLNERDLSLSSIEASIRLKPDYVDSHLVLGQIHLDRKRPDLALLAFEKVTQLAPASSSGWAALAFAYWDQGDLIGTRSSLQQALALKPDDIAALNLKGNLDAALGMTAEALTAFDKAISLSDKNYAALMSSALLLGNHDRISEAIERVEAALAILPNAKNAHETLGDLRLLQALADRELHRAVTVEGTQCASLDEYSAIIRDQVSPPVGTNTITCFFHVAQTQAHAAHQYQPGGRPDYISILGITLAQARSVLGAHVVILTDAATQFPENFTADIVRLPLKREWIMYERMRAERAFASSGRMTASTMFLDTDIYVLDSFGEVFADDFDVGLTWRQEFPLMPVNEGIILAHAGRAEKVVRFFDGCLRNYEDTATLASVRERYKFDIREWRGGQLSLARHLHWRTPARDMTLYPNGVIFVDDVKIKFFPDHELNFAFKPTIANAVLNSKRAIHFKGSEAKRHLSAFHARADRAS